MRTNLVYWGKEKIETKVIPMTFLQMGKAFDNIDEDKSGDFENVAVDKVADFDKLCEYLKLFHARSKCIMLVTQNNHKIHITICSQHRNTSRNHKRTKEPWS